MTIVVLLLSAGSIMSVSLFRFWRTNRSCLVMFAGGLALEKILVICLRILSACSDGSVDD